MPIMVTNGNLVHLTDAEAKAHRKALKRRFAAADEAYENPEKGLEWLALRYDCSTEDMREYLPKETSIGDVIEDHIRYGRGRLAISDWLVEKYPERYTELVAEKAAKEAAEDQARKEARLQRIANALLALGAAWVIVILFWVARLGSP